MSARKYATVFAIAARDQVVYIASFLMRNVFFVIILFVFYSLWRVIYGGAPDGVAASGATTIAGFTMVQVLWYLTFTETIELSQTRVFMPISAEVKDGTIAYSLCRPYSYVLYWISRSMGENIVKIAPMLLTGFVVATLFVGPLPGYLTALPVGLVAIVMGVLIGTTVQTIIGLLAFWFEEVSPFWWIIQKLVFVIGGMFIPLDFYPEWLANVARWSPFAFVAYWPASTWVDFSFDRAMTTIVGQFVYAVALLALAAGVFRSAVRKLHVQGG
ncbi:MAG: hypothetical protein EA382_07480 [Spirochaetaceae bacterium]|nr:MAG: hypothetical protein EA382_07480 [Spirochaetaceae bacterium]